MSNRHHGRFMMTLVFIGFLLMWVHSAPAAAKNPAAVVLGSGRLQVEVMDPNAPDRYNSGVRFSPVATVLRATLDGKEFLFNPATHNPITENCGLGSEFDPVTPEAPPGFQEAAIGNGFVKIGVGVLRKSEAEYHFGSQYELITPALTTVTWGPDQADFEQICEGVNGYAYQLKAKVTVTGEKLQIAFRLKNIGMKPFVTQHCNLNGFCFDGKPVGPEYTLEFPYDCTATGLQPEQAQRGRMLCFDKAIPQAVTIDIITPTDYFDANTLVVRHAGNGMSIRMETSVRCQRTVVQAAKNRLCPEQFMVLKLKPGDIREWIRSYEFVLPAK